MGATVGDPVRHGGTSSLESVESGESVEIVPVQGLMYACSRSRFLTISDTRCSIFSAMITLHDRSNRRENIPLLCGFPITFIAYDIPGWLFGCFVSL